MVFRRTLFPVLSLLIKTSVLWLNRLFAGALGMMPFGALT